MGSEEKDERMNIRISSAQKSALADEADKLGMKVADLVRRKLDAVKVTVVTDSTDKKKGRK